MALIEGVGDEVTVLFSVLACLLVLALAWVSTHTTESTDPLPQSSGTTTPAQPSEAMTAIDSIREEAPGAESPSLRHRGPSAQPEPEAGVTASTPPDSPQEPLLLRLKFLNDSEQVARAWPQDTIGSLKRTQFPGREQQVRLIYQGQLLGDDTQTLGSLHLPPNCVLHCHPSVAPAASAAAPALVLPDPVPALLSPDRYLGPGRLHPAPQSPGLCHVSPVVPPRAFGSVDGPSGPHSPRRKGSCCLPRPTSPAACLFPLPWSPALRNRGLQVLAEATPCDLHSSGPSPGAAGPQPSLTVGSSESGTCCRCLGLAQSQTTPMGPS
uniref:Transmembrane and ubiquitin-like domain-containing protein 1 n=1 Tax=Rattus norvegicus TaxID=10116 RepID=A0A8L2UN18_RAT